MSIKKVLCPNNLKIEIIDTGNKSATCPNNCPLKIKERCRRVSFSFSNYLNDRVRADVLIENNKSENETFTNSQNESINTINNVFDNIPLDNVVEENHNISQPATYDSFTDEKCSNQNSYNPFEDIENDDDTPTKVEVKNVSNVSKWNDKINADSIFYGIVRPKPDECCLRDGFLRFYEVPKSGYNNDVKSAFKHIFMHWYISKVFTADEKHYTPVFLKLLKIIAYDKPEHEKELVKIVNDNKLNINQKFFRVFYDIIYKDELTQFYWSNVESPLSVINPMFNSEEDFIYKFVHDNYFYESILECLDEVLDFLHLTKEDFVTKTPLIIAEKDASLVLVDNISGSYELRNFGTIESFVENWLKFSSFEELQSKCKLIRNFKITSAYKLLKREKPLEISSSFIKEDDSVYASSYIDNVTTSASATAYNYYMTIIKEYIDEFKPNKIDIGILSFTKYNFYEEIIKIVFDACLYLTNQDASINDESKQKFDFLISLLHRGVLNYYESFCETSKLEKIKDEFLIPNKLNLKTYFKSDIIDAKIWSDNTAITIDEYFLQIIGNDIISGVEKLNKNNIIKTWFAAKIDEANLRKKQEDLKTLMKKM